MLAILLILFFRVPAQNRTAKGRQAEAWLLKSRLNYSHFFQEVIGCVSPLLEPDMSDW